MLASERDTSLLGGTASPAAGCRFMTASLITDDRLERDADAPLEIAVRALPAQGQVADETRTSEFLARSIMRRMLNGERHKIRLANHAIDDYEARFLIEAMAE